MQFFLQLAMQTPYSLEIECKEREGGIHLLSGETIVYVFLCTSLKEYGVIPNT